MMLQITPDAALYLKRALVGVEEPDNACFRISVGHKGPQLSLDQSQPEDTTIEHDGDTLLAMDSDTADQLSERTLAYDTERSQLVITPAQ